MRWKCHGWKPFFGGLLNFDYFSVEGGLILNVMMLFVSLVLCLLTSLLSLFT